MVSSQCCSTSGNLRVRGIDEDAANELKNIAAHIGISKTKLLKQCVYQIVKSAPDDLKKKKKITRKARLAGDTKLTNISAVVINGIENIAHNMHIDPSALIKCEVVKLIHSYPEHMRKPLMK